MHQEPRRPQQAGVRSVAAKAVPRLWISDPEMVQQCGQIRLRQIPRSFRFQL